MSDTLTGPFITASAVLLGSVISLVSALLVVRRAAQAEERRHSRKLGLEIGNIKFEHSLELAQKAADMTGTMAPFPSYEAHLTHGMRIMEIIADDRLSPEEMARLIAESVERVHRMNAAAQEHC